jgi:hypothetical protein
MKRRGFLSYSAAPPRGQSRRARSSNMPVIGFKPCTPFPEQLTSPPLPQAIHFGLSRYHQLLAGGLTVDDRHGLTGRASLGLRLSNLGRRCYWGWCLACSGSARCGRWRRLCAGWRWGR